MENDETRTLCVKSVLESIIAKVCLDFNEEEASTNRQEKEKESQENDKKLSPEKSQGSCYKKQQCDKDARSIEESQMTIRNFLKSLESQEEECDNDEEERALNLSFNSTFSSMFGKSDKTMPHRRRFYSYDHLPRLGECCSSRQFLSKDSRKFSTRTLNEEITGSSLQVNEEDQKCAFNVGTFPRKDKTMNGDVNKSSSLTAMSTLFKEFSINQSELVTPQQINEIPIDLLHSGIAILSGTLDRRGRQVLVIRIDELTWNKVDIERDLLAVYLMYLTCRLTSSYVVLIDARSSNISQFTDTAIESLGLLQEYGKNYAAQFEVLFLTEESHLQTENLKPYIEGRLRTSCEVLTSLEELHLFVTVNELPQQLSGSKKFSQSEWIQSRLVVDSYVVLCENTCKKFDDKTAFITSQNAPDNIAETKKLLIRHRSQMKDMMSGELELKNLRNKGIRVLEQVQQCDCHDKKKCIDTIHEKSREASKAVARYTSTSENWLIELERHLLVKKFQHSYEHIKNWYDNIMPIIEKKFSKPAENSESLRGQIKEFDISYLQVTKQLSKCKEIVKEAEEYKQLGYITVELSKVQSLENFISKLMVVMDQRKNEVDAAAEMYRFVDQAYSWALNGMKFVVMLSVDECVNIDKCQEMINKFDNYMKQHPPITEETFKEIFTLARRYGNKNCIRQCDFAEQKCKETLELFKKRRELLVKAKLQLVKAKKRSLSSSFRMRNRDSLDAKSKISSPSLKPQEHETTKEEQEKNTSATKSPPKIKPMLLTEAGRRRISMQSVESKNSSTSEDTSSAGDLSANGTLRSIRGIEKKQEFCYGGFRNSSLRKSQSMKLSKKPAFVVNNLSSNRASQANRRSIGSIGVLVKSPLHSPSGSLDHRPPISASNSFSRLEKAPSSELDQDDDQENEAKVKLTIDELISTEKDYVKSLNYVIQNYVPEMSRLDLPHALRCKRNVVFGNLENIAEFHSNRFLQQLQECKDKPQSVAKVFKNHKDSFSLYALYSKNKPQSDLLLAEHGNEFFKSKQIELGDKMNLASYLLKPVQRMAKYALLLHRMAKRSHGDTEKYLKEAESLVKFQLRHGNDLLTMDSIRGCDVNLKEQGNLLRQEQFTIYSGRKKIIRRVFLFEDLILFSKPVSVSGGHDIYHYKCSYKTAEIGMTENIGDSGNKFEIWFRRRKSRATQATFVLHSNSRAVKSQWVQEIRSLLWKQALRNKDYRKVEMSSMGIGNKPHIDLTPSNGNSIVDRSVVPHSSPSNLSPDVLYERVAHSRSRASIAVTNNIAVRPQSIVSNSSSTSSKGSNPSSMVSSLSLASWPAKRGEPRRNYATLPNSHHHLPLAYCDFHAIAEDDEGIPESLGSSSMCTTPGQTTTTLSCSDDNTLKFTINSSPMTAKQHIYDVIASAEYERDEDRVNIKSCIEKSKDQSNHNLSVIPLELNTADTCAASENDKKSPNKPEAKCLKNGSKIDGQKKVNFEVKKEKIAVLKNKQSTVSSFSPSEKPKELLADNENVRESLLGSEVSDESMSEQVSPQMTEKNKSLTTTV